MKSYVLDLFLSTLAGQILTLAGHLLTSVSRVLTLVCLNLIVCMCLTELYVCI